MRVHTFHMIEWWSKPHTGPTRAATSSPVVSMAGRHPYIDDGDRYVYGLRTTARPTRSGTRKRRSGSWRPATAADPGGLAANARDVRSFISP